MAGRQPSGPPQPALRPENLTGKSASPGRCSPRSRADATAAGSPSAAPPSPLCRIDKWKFAVNGVGVFSGVTACLFPLTVLKTRRMVLPDASVSQAPSRRHRRRRRRRRRRRALARLPMRAPRSGAAPFPPRNAQILKEEGPLGLYRRAPRQRAVHQRTPTPPPRGRPQQPAARPRCRDFHARAGASASSSAAPSLPEYYTYPHWR